MGGEHLQIANYDSLSEEEILAKLDVIAAGPGVNVPAFRDYEESREDGSRSAIIKKLDELESPPEEATPDVEPQAETADSPTTHPDEPKTPEAAPRGGQVAPSSSTQDQSSSKER